MLLKTPRRPPSRGTREFPFSSQPPQYFSWSSQAVGYPVPGLVSTLFHHMYSVPLRSVQMFLQAIEQVWQPMHLSRWKTIEICERTFIAVLLSQSTKITTSARGVGAPGRECPGCSR